MTISYNWLCEYLAVKPSSEKLSTILTSIGLEVESLEKYESVKGGLKGLVIGEVIESGPHPDADKLKLTRVNVGRGELLQIVCGAPNVAVGQKVVVAPVGTQIFPVKGEPVTMKLAKIRGVESQGMICAEDEIGLGENHEGILVLPADAPVGLAVADYLKPYEDHIFEIGLTPNHMDAMSHQGVARDVSAWLSHHEQREYKVVLPAVSAFSTDNNQLPIAVSIEDRIGCERFSGVSISGIRIQASPGWMQEKLKAIGLRPINNIVDITNFVLHETGQPLHAYDADQIKGKKVIVRKLPEGTKFQTLDEKQRTLFADDLMICNAEEPMCIAGVFGGLTSGVKENSKNIFLESAWFNPAAIRKTSLRHGLRTDAAIHFEKGMDISNTVYALKRAAILIRELAGGSIASEIADVYPAPREKTRVSSSYAYLRKISGKQYAPETVQSILKTLGFDILKQDESGLTVGVPYHKPDINLPADLAEEVMRIDGYDQIEIPVAIRISPSVETDRDEVAYHEKIADWLVGQGFSEIFTNSITNSAYFNEKELQTAVRMINSLSAELDTMRPSLLETGLETLAYNLNRKNNDLRFFEFGKTYHSGGIGQYRENNHLCLYLSGNRSGDSWKVKSDKSDFYYLKGLCESILELIDAGKPVFEFGETEKLGSRLRARIGNLQVLEAGMVASAMLKRFDIKQTVYFADLDWDNLRELIKNKKIEFRELPRQLPVYRDLALLLNKSVSYEEVEKATLEIGLEKLNRMQLFDIFESEKLGAGKKSLAISFTFLDEEKTLTDKEIDGMMSRIIKTLEERLGAMIRK